MNTLTTRCKYSTLESRANKLAGFDQIRIDCDYNSLYVKGDEDSNFVHYTKFFNKSDLIQKIAEFLQLDEHQYKI
jgi:hypothetical protein